MYEKFKLNNWLVARKGCAIGYEIHSDTEMDFTLGDQGASFGLCLDIDALREFLRQGQQALQEMDALRADEDEAAQTPG